MDNTIVRAAVVAIKAQLEIIDAELVKEVTAV